MKSEKVIFIRFLKTVSAVCCGVFLAGCAGEQVYKARNDPAARLARALRDVCEPLSVNPSRVDVTVKIKFRDIGEGVLCPFEVDQACPLTFKGNKIAFVAVDENGDPFRYPPRYKIYFDPINGKTINAPNGEGDATIDAKAPAGIYKYTVWDWPEGSDDPVCDPLDPNFRVD